VEALPNRYRANAQWLAPLALLNSLRTVTVGEGLGTPALAEGNPPTYQGRAIHENSYLPAGVVGIVGDLRNFLIVQRIGSTVEFVPHLFSANRLPYAARGFFMHRRVGSDVLVPDAFRVLSSP
jgi:HK97 family phage major capsid protein